MKKIALLFLIMTTCFTAHADDITWHEYETVTSQHNHIKVLDRKLKVIDLSALRKWKFIEQAYNSISMELKTCKVKVEFNDNNTIIKHNGFTDSGDGWGRNMFCKEGWLRNLKKDIILASTIIALQQEAIEMDKKHSQEKITLSE